MIKTPYNTLNISINELDENKDEKIFRKFIKMIEWIEDEKIRQRNYKKEDNLNYEERKEKHIQNQEIYKRKVLWKKTGSTEFLEKRNIKKWNNEIPL